MNRKEICPKDSSNTFDFWTSLQAEFIVSNQELSTKKIASFVERTFIFSMFFGSSSPSEIVTCQKLLQLNDYAYMILIEMYPFENADYSNDPIDIYHIDQCIKGVSNDKQISIGPIISNQVSILVSTEYDTSSDDMIKKAIDYGKTVIKEIHKEFGFSCSAGIGTIQSFASLNLSLIEAVNSLRYCKKNQVTHVLHTPQSKQDHQFDFTEIEKHLLESIRLKKVEAYSYFHLLMSMLEPFSDNEKRNKTLELIVMINRIQQMDGPSYSDHVNYEYFIKELFSLSGHDIIQWASQKFVLLTGIIKPQNSIDYSNKIVQTTKDYLEAHYAEDISLEDLAQQVNMSTQYLSKLIKKSTGFNFMDWLTMLRVKKAKELLSHSDMNVKEVCYHVGYKDPNYFSRIFKKRTGITPSEYVKSISMEKI